MIMKDKVFLMKIVFCTISIISFWTMISAQNLTINMQDFGATGDGKIINTEKIQSAIDKVHSQGGGVVYFPAGEWMTGKIFLKSNVTIDISPEATLLAAPGPIYSEPKGSIESLIYGDQLENIGIWDRDANIEAWKWYLGGKEADEYAAPSRATNLKGLPLTFIDVGEVDLFRDEDIEFVQKLLKAAVSTEFHLYPGAYHASEIIAPTASLSLRIWEVRYNPLKRALYS
jgi:hypothetical protein